MFKKKNAHKKTKPTNWTEIIPDSHKNLYRNVYSRFSHNQQKLQTTQPVSKETVVCPHNSSLLHYKRNRLLIHATLWMNLTCLILSKIKQLFSKEFMEFMLKDMTFWKRQVIRTENRSVSRSWSRRRLTTKGQSGE